MNLSEKKLKNGWDVLDKIITKAQPISHDYNSKELSLTINKNP